MREILFRGKRKNCNEFPENEWWITGFYVKCRGHHYILPVYDADHGFDERYADWVEVEKETVCQYTGLTDKNGRKIFEGDIVRRTDLRNAKEPSIGLIEYDAENTSFLIHWTDVQNYSATFPWKDKIEVIGNVFDNPELIE